MSLLQKADQHPPIIHPDTSVADAIRAMVENRVGGVSIVDSERVVVGIFTERDVLVRFALSGRDPHRTLVREIMTTPVEMASEDTSDEEALTTMLLRHYRHLPIVDSDGRLLGMLSIRRVLEARVEELLRELGAAKGR